MIAVQFASIISMLKINSSSCSCLDITLKLYVCKKDFSAQGFGLVYNFIFCSLDFQPTI